jgi:hypothetical protein
MANFATTRQGTDKPLTCRFCNQPVWFNLTNRRYYNTDGLTMHNSTCSRGQAYYKEQAAQRVQKQREQTAQREQQRRTQRRR